jgi:MFS family permease
MVAISLVDRIETSVVPGVLPLLQEEWGFGDTAGGAIPTAGAIAGILVALPAGYLADRVNRTRLLGWVVASWSLVIALSGLAVSFGMFFATRVVLGAADSLDGPSASSVLADYYPPSSRGKVFGYHRLSAFVGGGLGVLLGGLVGGIFGWRAAFFFMIIPGLLVAWLTARLAEPPRGLMDRLVADIGGPVAEEDEPPVPAEPPPLSRDGGWRARATELRDLLRVKTVFHVYVGITALFIGLAGIFFWLPSYYERTYDLAEEGAAALAAVLALVATIIGTVVGGTVGDRWHGSRPGGRIVLAGGGLLAGSAVMPAAFLVDALWLHVLVLFPALIAMSLAIPNLSAAVADVLPAHQRGIGFGLFSFLTAIGAAIGPLAVGAASDAIGSLETAFLVLVAPIVVGSVVVLGARQAFDSDVAAVLDAARRRSH